MNQDERFADVAYKLACTARSAEEESEQFLEMIQDPKLKAETEKRIEALL